MSSEQPSDRRRSTRVLVKIPLKLSGSDPDGNYFEISGNTLMVNKHGAKVRTTMPLSTGMEVVVEVQSGGRHQRAHVVWEDAGGLNIYGIELTSPENLWGISFPPEDWTVEAPQVSA